MITKTLKTHETSSFVLEWLKAPRRTASIIPSSTQLAKKMVNGLNADSGPIIELGPGTGVFTRQLLANGVPESALTLIELNRTFAFKLKAAHRQARVINGSAESLIKIELEPSAAIISGLPFLSMRDQQVDQILAGAIKTLRPDGIFIQFTYGYRCPVKADILKKYQLIAHRHSFVFNNFPPASVYYLQRAHTIPF